MIHRKQNHDVPECRELKSDGGCSKTDEDCWYLHKMQQNDKQTIEVELNTTTPASMKNSTILAHTEYTNSTEPHVDFPQAASNKTTPETPKVEGFLINLMTLIKEQNKTMLEIMTKMMQNQSIKITPASQVRPYQS